jgi:hypothetical protein
MVNPLILTAAVTLALTLSSLLTQTPAQAQRVSCPVDALAASFDIWPQGSIKVVPVSATHPCGRRLSCVPGQYDAGKPRQCRWL